MLKKPALRSVQEKRCTLGTSDCREPGGGDSRAQDSLGLGLGLRGMTFHAVQTWWVKNKFLKKDLVNRYYSCSTSNTKQHCGKQCSPKHVKLSLAFAQACQTTYSEMPCAYYN